MTMEFAIERLGQASRDRLTAKHPALVSVIIPVYNKWDVTARCLASLFSCDTSIALQVIVVDDGSSDETPDMLSRIPGIDVVRNGTNSGFLLSCNTASAIAKGRYLFFLNNDTEVFDGSIRALVERIESNDEIGIVGSKLIYPDGRLQEAGGIIWSDAGGWNYGRLDRPDRPEYAFVRDVDYVSGAALLISADLFHAVGGFDRQFAPAYYEDADLCFSVRAAGKRVVYEPTSIVRHYEGISSGTDITTGTKRFQEINRPKFRAKWREVLTSEHCDPDPASVRKAARLRGGHRRSILVVDSYVPLYDREAGSNRLHHLVGGFLESESRVVFFPDNGLPMEPYASEMQQRGIEVLYRSRTDQRDWKALFVEALAGVDIVWLCRPLLFRKYLSLIRAHSKAPIIYDTIDLHHLRMQREAAHFGIADDAHWKGMQALELACATAADATILVAQSEADVVIRAGAWPVAVVPTIHDPEPSGSAGFAATSGLIFIGGYNHTPNVDAAKWLAGEIMPMVWERLPEMTLVLLGSNPPESVSALAEPRISVPGYVPDVSPFFRTARLFVAPLRFGAGINGKIGQALAFGIPIVTTPVGASGFGLVDGSTARVVNDARSFSAAVIELYLNRALWESISKASEACLEPFYSANIVLAAVTMIDSLLKSA